MEAVLLAIAIFVGSILVLYKLFGGTASGASAADGGFAAGGDTGSSADSSDSGGSGE